MKDRPLKAALVCPTPAEYSICSRGLGLGAEKVIAGRPVSFRRENGMSVAAVQAGPGKEACVRAVRDLIDREYGDVFLDTGTAGSLSPEVEIGDIVCGEHAYETDISSGLSFASGPPGRSVPSLLPGLNSEGRDVFKEFVFKMEARGKARLRVGGIAAVSGDVNKETLRRKLFQKYRTLACNWETYAVLHTAGINGKSGLSFRVVSDRASENMEEEYGCHCERVLHILASVLEPFLFDGWLKRLLKCKKRK